MTPSYEAAIDHLNPGLTVSRIQRDIFDPHCGVFLDSPAYNVIDAPSLNENLPDETWVLDQFTKFVRIEFGSKRCETEPLIPLGTAEEVDFLKTALQVRNLYEQNLAHDAERILKGVAGNLARSYDILCSNAFGSRENRKNISYESLSRALNTGYELVVPGLPFRDQNPLRTQNEPDEVTLAEAYFLTRLHCTALALTEATSIGASVTVISDGSLYAPIFDVKTRDADTYLKRVRSLRDFLGFDGTVAIVDLNHLIRLYDRGTGKFMKSVAHIEKILTEFRQTETDAVESFIGIERGIRWNLNTRKYVEPFDVFSHWAKTGDVGKSSLPGPEYITEKAIRYAAVNLALRWHELIRRMLPSSIRATVHAKQGQVALPRLGSVFPWNGVAILEENNEVSIMPLADAKRPGYQLSPSRTPEGVVAYYRWVKL